MKKIVYFLAGVLYLLFYMVMTLGFFAIAGLIFYASTAVGCAMWLKIIFRLTGVICGLIGCEMFCFFGRFISETVEKSKDK